MKLTFRWYGPSDRVTLDQIREIPTMSGVVTAIYDIKVGEEWPLDKILALKQIVNAKGLEMEVIESVPVPEDIKLGTGKRDYYIANYIKTIQNLAKAGVKCICYNFMPVFDWLRTTLAYQNKDGSTSLAYLEEDFKKLDPKNLHLPGWDESYKPEELQKLLNAYQGMSHESLLGNMVYFLKAIMPACEAGNVKMAVHPDDPPWDIFGLPRIVSNEKDYDNLFAAVPSKCNGVTLCTGSLGASRANDVPALADKLSKENRVFFLHLRNIRHFGENDFQEVGHPSKCGSLNMAAIVEALVKNGFDGYVRPDHGRTIWNEPGKPGYGLFDRALGATYIAGLFEEAERRYAK